MNNVIYNQIRIFQSIAREGSISAAAVESLERSVESIKDLNREPSGLVRITMSRFAYQLILKPLMAEFCQCYPGIQLEISVFD